MSNEGRFTETALDPEVTETWDRLGECSAQIQSKHKHKDVTGEHECKNMTEC